MKGDKNVQPRCYNSMCTKISAFGNVEVGNGSEGWRWVRRMALGVGDAVGYGLWCGARGRMFCELLNGEM